MEIIRACGLNIFLETAPVRREMVWESVTPPGHWIGTLLEGSLSVEQEGFGSHLWQSGGGTIFSASEHVHTRHVVLRDGGVAAVFVQIEEEMAEPLMGALGDMLVIDAEVTAGIQAHASDAEEFAIVVSGRFEVTMNGVTLPCGPGDHLVVEAGVEHAIRVVEPGRLVLIGKM